MDGTVAITDHGWYEFLLAQGSLDEVNFWTPSAHWGFRGEVGSPFFFKLLDITDDRFDLLVNET